MVLRLHAFRVPFLALVAALAVLFTRVPLALAQASNGDAGDAEACGPSAACPLDALPPVAAAEDAGVPQAVTLVFFWGVGCPHCEEAKPFLDALEKQETRLRVERVEVRQDPEGRRRFLETMKQLGATAVGIPTFVIGSAYVVGYSKGETDREVSALVRRALSPKNAAVEPGSPRTINLPFIGTVELSFSGSCFSGSCSTWRRRGVACSSIRPRSS
jgi:thiol-disulfide isomerase/thioredoxin